MSLSEPAITFGTRVAVADCSLPGRVNMVWQSRSPVVGSPIVLYYRVQFPPRSPFVGDWAVFRQGELTPITTTNPPPQP